jgi:hypothetical protein
MSKQSFRYVAKQNGNKHYMSDKPCKRGHLSLRITSTGTCTECKKILERDRYYLDLTKTKEKVQKNGILKKAKTSLSNLKRRYNKNQGIKRINLKRAPFKNLKSQNFHYKSLLHSRNLHM